MVRAFYKRYIFHLPEKEYYVTGKNKRNGKSLLSIDEKTLIKASLKGAFERTQKRDQISLMYMVLSDIRVAEELWKQKKRPDELSSLSLIGVVGGYIGELITEPEEQF